MPLLLGANLLPQMRWSQLFNEEDAIAEPMTGIPDGRRRTFFTQNAPLVNDPSGLWGVATALVVTDAAENVIPANLYTITNTRKGAVQFASAPAQNGSYPWPYQATYRWANLDLEVLYRALQLGFAEMEGRLSRGYTLVPQGGTTTPIAGQLDLAVLDPQTGGDPVGPGSVTFSGSQVQTDFLLMCGLYRLARDYMHSSVKTGYIYREGRMGMQVDPTPALKLSAVHLAEIAAALNSLAAVATAEWDQNSSGMGAGILNPQSEAYQTLFAWPRSPFPQGTTPYGGIGWQ